MSRFLIQNHSALGKMYGLINNISERIYGEEKPQPKTPLYLEEAIQPEDYIRRDEKPDIKRSRQYQEHSSRHISKKSTRIRKSSIKYARKPSRDSMFDLPKSNNGLDAFFTTKITTNKQHVEHQQKRELSPPPRKNSAKIPKHVEHSIPNTVQQMQEQSPSTGMQTMREYLPTTIDFAQRYANGYINEEIGNKVYIHKDINKVEKWKKQIIRLKQKLSKAKQSTKHDKEILKLTSTLATLERQAFGHHLGILYVALEEEIQGHNIQVPKRLPQSPESSSMSVDSNYKDQIQQINTKLTSAYDKIHKLEDKSIEQSNSMKKLYSKIPRSYKKGPFSMESFEKAVAEMINDL